MKVDKKRIKMIRFSVGNTGLKGLDKRRNAYVKVSQRNRYLTCIEANREGLLSLADQLIKLADQDEEPILYEEWPGDLEEGSVALEIRRVDAEGRKNP